jgi:nucleotidyltransferase substrate binding protein (TIGR01987 family)
MIQKLEDANRACVALASALSLPSPSELERDGTIQRFEFTFEATWKAGQVFLERQEGIQANSPRATWRALGEAGLLDEVQTIRALEMTDDRNRTAHTYIEAVARQIYERIPIYSDLLTTLVGSMKSRCDSRS